MSRRKMGGVEGKPLRDSLARSATLPAGDQFAEQSAAPTKKETSVRMSLFLLVREAGLEFNKENF